MIKPSSSLLFLGGALLAGCTGQGGSGPDLASSEHLIGIIPGTVTCAAQGLGTQQFTLPSIQSGQYQVDASNSFIFQFYDSSNTSFFFTQSTIRMNAVIVSANGYSTVWDIGGANGWPSLGAIDPATNDYAVPGSVSFCFDYELFLNPNGYAHYGQRQGWDIAKTGYEGEISLAAGQSFLAPYTVTVTPTTLTPTTAFIAGPVFLNNPTPFTPTIEAVTVMVGELPATVTCPQAYPFVAPAFSVTTCNFTVDVPDTADRLVYVDVVSDGIIGIDRSLETASFADHTTSTEQFDECVAIYDDKVAGGFLGTACASGGTQTFNYTAEIGPFEHCGAFSVTNTATWSGFDTGATGSTSYVVGGEVPCSGGCTLTPGYWKNHSELGPARYDETWALLANGAATPFFLSGQTYHQVLQTPVAGNAYYILARAYIAAQLNRLNGSDFTVATSAFNEATTLLTTYAPRSTQFTSKSSTVRTRAIQLAHTLDDYNNGLIGPGHCTE